MKEYIVPVDSADMDCEELFVGHVRQCEELIRCINCRKFTPTEGKPKGFCHNFGCEMLEDKYCAWAEERNHSEDCPHVHGAYRPQ